MPCAGKTHLRSFVAFQAEGLESLNWVSLWVLSQSEAVNLLSAVMSLWLPSNLQVYDPAPTFWFRQVFFFFFFGQPPDESVFKTCSDLSIFSNFSTETRWIPLLLFTQFKNVNNVVHEDFWLDFPKMRKNTAPFPWWHNSFGITLAIFWGWYCLEAPVH